MFWLTIIFGGAIFLIWYYGVKPYSYWKDKNVKQGKPWFFFGDIAQLVFQKVAMCQYVEDVYKKFPGERYNGIYNLIKPTLLVRDPELIKLITVKDFDHFVDHNTLLEPDVDPLWGGNLIALKGQKWRHMRATVSPIFTSSKMKIMYGLMYEAAESFVKFFKDKKEDVVNVELKDIYTRYTNDVIATTAFGIKVDSLSYPDNVFYKMGLEVTKNTGFIMMLKVYLYFLFPSLAKALKLRLFQREVSDYFSNIINDTIKIREEKGILRPDLINLFLEARKGTHKDGEAKNAKDITNTEITAQALIFFFAGFDTISTALCFGSYELTVNKDIQDKLRQEIKTTFDENDGKVTYEVLLGMKYLDMVVSEMLRKWPPAMTLDRLCTKAYELPPSGSNTEPVTIQAGEMLWIPIQGIQRDPAYFPDPEKFDPERFLDENKEAIKPYTYLPFGAGPRNCIGSRFALLEAKVLLFHLLYHFEIVPIDKTPIPLKLSTSFTHSAEGGFWVGLKKID